MENRKYTVCRDDIYVGEVIKPDEIYYSEYKEGKLDISWWKSCRSMLFVPNADNMADDLLYNSPNYPILNLTDDRICLDPTKNSIVIKDAYNISLLLKYFDYDKDLTYKDIVGIRKIFFYGRFAKNNCELFGYKKIMTERKKESKCEMFSSVSESELPREYFDVLDNRGDNSILDILNGFEEKRNVFKPDKVEGKVKKLTRF